MTSIFDKENDREILKAGELGNHLVVYEDRPMKYDAWDIDIYYQEKGYEVDDLKTVSVEKSSLMTKVKMDWNYQDSTISQEIRFYNDNRRIDFVTHADWHEHQQLLRVLFPLDIRTSEATFDIQYGNVKRPTYENTSWDMAKFETVAHQWADYSETGIRSQPDERLQIWLQCQRICSWHVADQMWNPSGLCGRSGNP